MRRVFEGRESEEEKRKKGRPGRMQIEDVRVALEEMDRIEKKLDIQP